MPGNRSSFFFTPSLSSLCRMPGKLKEVTARSVDIHRDSEDGSNAVD